MRTVGPAVRRCGRAWGRAPSETVSASRRSRSTCCGDAARDLADALAAALGLVGRHQAEMALDDAHARVVGHRADHGHVGVVLDHGAQLGLVAAAAQAVEDDAGDADVPVEGLVAEDQRRDAARHAARVEHQHHRQRQQVGQGGIAVGAVEVEAVVEALVALDQADVGVRAVARELGPDLVIRRQEEIEVAAGAAGGQAEPERIDVVRSLLERLHRESARPQRRGEADTDSGLAGRLVGGRNEEPVHRQAPGTDDSAARAGDRRQRFACPGAGCSGRAKRAGHGTGVNR